MQPLVLILYTVGRYIFKKNAISFVTFVCLHSLQKDVFLHSMKFVYFLQGYCERLHFV